MDQQQKVKINVSGMLNFPVPVTKEVYYNNIKKQIDAAIAIGALPKQVYSLTVSLVQDSVTVSLDEELLKNITLV